MKKTTLYIEDEILKKLKLRTIQGEGASMTALINDALRNFLSERPSLPRDKFQNLKQARSSSPAFKKIKDPVAYQKKLRSEWD